MKQISKDTNPADQVDTGEPISPVPQINIDAFCETEGVADLVRLAASDRRMASATVRVHMGGALVAAELYKDTPSARIVIIEAGGDPSVVLQQLDICADVFDPETRVFIIGHANDVLLYRELKNLGVSEYLVFPFSPVILVRAISHIFSAPGAAPVGKIIAITGCKGGVGSSTISHNLAYMTSRLGIGTILVDLDVAFGTASLHFDQDENGTIADALNAGDDLDDALLGSLLKTHSQNLSLLTAPAKLDNYSDIPEVDLRRILNLLRNRSPLIIVDLPHLWQHWVRSVFLLADDIILVAEPDLANLRNAKVLTSALEEFRPNDRKPSLLLNKVGMQKRQEITEKEFTKALGVSIVESIDFKPDLFSAALNKGEMISQIQSASQASKAVETLAKSLIGRAESRVVRQNKIGSLLSKLRGNKS